MSPPDKFGDLIPSADWFSKIIKSVTEPLGFCVLLVLILFVALVVTPLLKLETITERIVVVSLLSLLAFVVIAFFFILIKFKDRLFPNQGPYVEPPETPQADSFLKSQEPDDVPGQWKSIYGADRPAPPINTWNRRLRPALYQASYYSIPTYYLDPDLNIIDFNAAFEAIFRRIAGTLRGQHVNWFINAMVNSDDMFREGQKFTEEVAEKRTFPFVHTEPIVYNSDSFGRVEFTKIASQLHNPDGQLCGWSVGLIPREIDWPDFEEMLKTKLYQDKMWSVYSGPYDRILPKFAPYNQLIDDVISVVPNENLVVGDLGAGTGNVTKKLVAKGCRVVSIENSLGMLDRLTQKTWGDPNVNVVKASIENLGFLNNSFLDAVVMVNVLYAVDDPIGCLREVNRMLRPGGVVGMSTTHRDTKLDELLTAIEGDLKEREAEYPDWPGDFALLEQINRDIEVSIARRHTRESYRQFFEVAGFEISRVVDSTYHNAVMVIHAKKK